MAAQKELLHSLFIKPMFNERFIPGFDESNPYGAPDTEEGFIRVPSRAFAVKK